MDPRHCVKNALTIRSVDSILLLFWRLPQHLSSDNLLRISGLLGYNGMQLDAVGMQLDARGKKMQVRG